MGILIGAVIALGTLFWGITRLLDGASDAKFAWRRFSWLRKSTKPVPTSISDPREAAAIALLQVVSYGSGARDDDRAAVKAALVEEIAPDPREADELMTVAGLVLKEIGDANNKLRDLSLVIRQACSPEEKQGLVDKMTLLAQRGEGMSDVQKVFLDRFERALFQ